MNIVIEGGIAHVTISKRNLDELNTHMAAIEDGSRPMPALMRWCDGSDPDFPIHLIIRVETNEVHYKGREHARP